MYEHWRRLVTHHELADRAQQNLKALDTICKKGSEWAQENQKIFDESCNYDFAKANIDIAKKWWDLWLKNKQSKDAKDLVALTQQEAGSLLARRDAVEQFRYADDRAPRVRCVCSDSPEVIQ